MIISDLKHKANCFGEETYTKSFLSVLLSDGTSAVVFYRIASVFYSIKLGFIGWLFLVINKLLNGCFIGLNVNFKKGFVVTHPISVVISDGVKGGENIVIESGVVIGATRNSISNEVPVLGNNVFIGAGAKVLGGIKIGSNVKIGANAVVVKDVCDGATVVGIPGRIINLEG